MKATNELRMAAIATRVATYDAHLAALANTGPWHAYTDALRFQCVAEAELEAAGLTLHEPPSELSDDQPEHVEYEPFHGAVDISEVNCG